MGRNVLVVPACKRVGWRLPKRGVHGPYGKDYEAHSSLLQEKERGWDSQTRDGQSCNAGWRLLLGRRKGVVALEEVGAGGGSRRKR